MEIGLQVQTVQLTVISRYTTVITTVPVLHGLISSQAMRVCSPPVPE